MLTGGYVPGDSPFHRASAGAKVGLLAVFMIALVVVGGPVALVLAAACTVVGYGIARIPVDVAVAQVRPLRWVVALLFAFQWWAHDAVTALVVCGNLVVAVAGASLLTLTTHVDDLRTAAAAALRRVPGVDAERVGLLVALVLRSIPVVVGIADEARQARVARGVERSPRAFVTPILVRTIRHAERVGDALVARGVDD